MNQSWWGWCMKGRPCTSVTFSDQWSLDWKLTVTHKLPLDTRSTTSQGSVFQKSKKTTTAILMMQLPIPHSPSKRAHIYSPGSFGYLHVINQVWLLMKPWDWSDRHKMGSSCQYHITHSNFQVLAYPSCFPSLSPSTLLIFAQSSTDVQFSFTELLKERGKKEVLFPYFIN